MEVADGNCGNCGRAYTDQNRRVHHKSDPHCERCHPYNAVAGWS